MGRAMRGYGGRILFVDVPTGALADKQYAAKAREAVAAAATAHDRSDTTHVCAIDDQGNAVSLTHTLGSASGVVTPGYSRTGLRLT